MLFYATTDEPRVAEVAAGLDAHHVDYHLDAEIRERHGWREEFEAALRTSSVYALFVSPELLASDWAVLEIGLALARVRQGKATVLLVLLRDVVIPEHLRTFRALDARRMTGQEIAAEIGAELTRNGRKTDLPGGLTASEAAAKGDQGGWKELSAEARRGRLLDDAAAVAHEHSRTGRSADAIRRDFLGNLFCLQARFPAIATKNDQYMALAYTVRDRLLKRWINTSSTYHTRKVRTVCYLSAEFLPGPHLGNALINLGIWEPTRQAMAELGIALEDLLEQEQEPGLGSGGLGRLAACYLDSLSTLQIPAIGYGIRYEFGIFEQAIKFGWQVELADNWLRFGNPWEIVRPEVAFEVKLRGRTEGRFDADGRFRASWVPESVIRGVACDTPIPGYGVGTANLLRLWKAEACESFDLQAFNRGDYYGAVSGKIGSETVSKVLYPNDEPEVGKALRLQQQYFFVSCSLRDMLRIFFQGETAIERFPEKYAVQLNDTHPAIAVAELMRLLLDEHDLDWGPAWDVTRRTFAYTNHTLLPEALESWPMGLFASLLPRHLEIIFEINRRFLDDVRARFPGDEARVQRLSLIDSHGEPRLRMANLACVGCHAINGVAALHTELLESETLRDFHELWPEKFSNKTNGVTPRRFMVLANPGLSRLLAERIGEKWITDLSETRRLEPLADDAGFQHDWRRVKRAAKVDLARLIQRSTGVIVDPDSIFDIQAKRIHEYKRQHLNLLHVITLYNRIRRFPESAHARRTVIFAGKAAPSYTMAKLIIKLINSLADVVNNDRKVSDHLKVVFVPNFNVKNAQLIYPAADLSEQISTAGKEASGTGNMKFAMNGALTVGTLDGANVEIREAVGAENFFLFGLTSEDVHRVVNEGYRPREIYEREPELREALDQIRDGFFSGGDTEVFRPLVDSLIHHDPYLVLADYGSYVCCQKEVQRAYQDVPRWTRMSILNVARMGRFSSDRAVREYCEDIWNVSAVPVGNDPDLEPHEGEAARSDTTVPAIAKRG
jgi:starch phosphorylase